MTRALDALEAQYETAVRIKALGYDGERFAAYFWFTGWDCLSLGFHVCVSKPNIEIHLPFGFLKIGVP